MNKWNLQLKIHTIYNDTKIIYLATNVEEITSIEFIAEK